MGTLLRDVFEGAKLKADGRTLSGPFSFCESENRNGRKYTKRLWESVLEEVQPIIASNRLLGELDHPDEERNPEVLLKYASHKITNLHMEGDTVYGTLEILDTPTGQILQVLKEAGVPIMVSSRALGKTGNDGYVDEGTYSFITFDCVGDPSFDKAILNESATKSYLHKSIRALLDKADVADRAILNEGVKRVLGESYLDDDPADDIDSLPHEEEPDAPGEDNGHREDECEETDEIFVRNVIKGYRGIVETARVFVGLDISMMEATIRNQERQIRELTQRIPTDNVVSSLMSENTELMQTVERLTLQVQANADVRQGIQEQIDRVLADNAILESKLRVTTKRVEEGVSDPKVRRQLKVLTERAEEAEDERDSLLAQLTEANGRLQESTKKLICEQQGVDYSKNKDHLSNLMNEAEVVEKVKQIRTRSLRQLAPVDESVADQALLPTPSGEKSKRLARSISRV